METLKTSSEKMRYQGLSAAQVEANRKQYGVNVITPPERDPWWKLYLEKYNDPVIRILIIAAIIAIGTGIVDGKYVEGLGIVIAIFLATTLAFINEYQANREFDILNRANDEVPVKVIREGIYLEVPKKDVVRGDLVLIEAGEEVPADGHLLEAMSLQVDEASFTGESLPATKVTSTALEKMTPPETTYPLDQVLRGCIVRDGHGLMEVTEVGDATVIGKMAREIAGDEDEEDKVQTPLNLQLEKLSKLIGVLAFIIAGLTIAALMGRGIVFGDLPLSGQQWWFTAVLFLSVAVALVRVWLPVAYDGLELLGSEIEAPQWLSNDTLMGWLATILLGLGIFGVCYLVGIISRSPAEWLPPNAGGEFLMYLMIAMTVIVVAVPEGLAMSVTLSLAYSMRKMTATNNLVRRMHACETIGAATVICSDKTGTLTLNEMRVYEGNFPGLTNAQLSNEPQSLAASLIIEGIAANTTAQLSRIPGTPACPLGNPTECALLLWLDAQDIDYIIRRDNFEIDYQWTFSTDRKYMGTLGKSTMTDNPIFHAKGAPEIILQRCSQVLTEQGMMPLNGQRLAIENALREYQGRGMRTLGFAYHDSPANYDGVNIEEVAQSMTWLGFVAIADPLRPEVPPAMMACREAGVKVKMVTGDNPETAREIARQIGLWDDHDSDAHHLSGAEFVSLPEEEAVTAAQRLKILSRARPDDKLRLVKILQKQGEVVAVTGDGINDAPALKQAQVGLAMGKAGKDAAKEASDIILLDDSFGSIVKAVMWGRSLYENIQRFILFQLTVNVAACFIALLGPFIGIKLPLTVTQMLWVNLIMDTMAALALATEPPHASVLKNPPRSPDAFIITRSMAINIFSVGFIFLIVLVGFLRIIQRDGEPTPYALSVFFAVFVLLQFWNLFNARCLGQVHSAFVGIFQNKGFVIIASAIFVGQILMVQYGGSVFRTVPLSLRDWLVIIGGTSLVLWIGEIWRWARRLKS